MMIYLVTKKVRTFMHFTQVYMPFWRTLFLASLDKMIEYGIDYLQRPPAYKIQFDFICQ